MLTLQNREWGLSEMQVDSTSTQQMGPSGVLGTNVKISYLFLNAPCSAMPLNITSCSSFSLECSSPSTLHPPTIYQGNMGSRVQIQIFHQQSSQTVPSAILLSTPVRENWSTFSICNVAVCTAVSLQQTLSRLRPGRLTNFGYCLTNE